MISRFCDDIRVLKRYQGFQGTCMNLRGDMRFEGISGFEEIPGFEGKDKRSSCIMCVGCHLFEFKEFGL